MVSVQHKLNELLSGGTSLIPEGILALLFLLMLLFSMLNVSVRSTVTVAIVGLLISAFSVHLFAQPVHPDTFFLGTLRFDTLSLFFKYFFIAATSVSVLMVMLGSQTEVLSKGTAELVALMIAATLGLFLLVSTGNLPIIYLSLELVSISSYILTSFRKGPNAAEAGLKYLLYGAVCSAIMVYGMSWFYGITGQLQLFDFDIAPLLQGETAPAMLLALCLIAVGFMFKVALVPFHGWAPDVYEGSPTAVVNFFSIAPKAGGIILFSRFALAHWESVEHLQEILAVLIILTLTIGNFAALWQKDLKRMLAYSGIAQSGFILLPLLLGNAVGLSAMVYYLSIYLIMNSAAFFIILQMEKMNGSSAIEAQHGLGKKLPAFGVAATVVMISLTGLPPTAGFLAKLLVFSELWSAYEATDSTLLIFLFAFGLLNAAVSLFYYLRLPFVMFFRDAAGTIGSPSKAIMASVYLLAALLLLLFFFSGLSESVFNFVQV